MVSQYLVRTENLRVPVLHRHGCTQTTVAAGDSNPVALAACDCVHHRVHHAFLSGSVRYDPSRNGLYVIDDTGLVGAYSILLAWLVNIRNRLQGQGV
jgi:hypothetical protein